MTEERVVHRIGADGPLIVRLEAVDVTDARVHARKPYRITRGSIYSVKVILVELDRQQLWELGDAIAAERQRSPS